MATICIFPCCLVGRPIVKIEFACSAEQIGTKFVLSLF